MKRIYVDPEMTRILLDDVITASGKSGGGKEFETVEVPLFP